MNSLEYRNIMLERIKNGIPHVVVLSNGTREEFIKYHKETNTFTYFLGRKEFVLNNNAEIKPYHVFFDVNFTYKKERGEEFYKVFAVVKCSTKDRLLVSFCRSGIDLDKINEELLTALKDHIEDNTASLGMKMLYKIENKKYRGKIVFNAIKATNAINSIATKWRGVK